MNSGARRNDKGGNFNPNCRDEGERDTSGKGYNDVSWYTKYPSLTIASGQAQYINVPGMPLPILPTNVSNTNTIVPGVMSLDWCPNFGNTDDPLNAVNLAGQEIYTKVRDAYSGAIDADAPDYLMYLGALDSIFAFIGWLKRLYRAVSTYSPDNFQLPETMMWSQIRGPRQSVNSAIIGMRKHKEEFWSMINELCLATQKFKCPAVMDIMNRHYWMSDNVYADSNSPKAQLYVYTLRAVYQLSMLPIVGDDTNTAAGLKMVTIPLADGDTYYETLYNFGMTLINALDAWDDGYTISGYLRRAFEGSPNFVVALLEQKEYLDATYSEEVLSQIENFRSINILDLGMTSTPGVTNMSIQQDVIHNKVVANNTLQFNIQGAGADMRYASYLLAWAHPLGGLTTAPFINVRSDAPSVGDTIVASRMVAAITDIQATVASDKINATISFDAGTEVPLAAYIFNMSTAGNVDSYPVLPVMMAGTQATFTASGNQDISAWLGMILAESFDWHPITLFLKQGGNTPPGTLQAILNGDVHNTAVLTVDQLHSMHRVCIFSELNAFSLM